MFTTKSVHLLSSSVYMSMLPLDNISPSRSIGKLQRLDMFIDWDVRYVIAIRLARIQLKDLLFFFQDSCPMGCIEVLLYI